MATLPQTLTITYPQDAQLDLNTKVWFAHWINDQRGWVGNVIWNCPVGIYRGREVLGDLGDVRGKCSNTIPEWHKRNLVTLKHVTNLFFYKGRAKAENIPQTKVQAVCISMALDAILFRVILPATC